MIGSNLDLNGSLAIEIDPTGAGSSDIVDVDGQLLLSTTSTLNVSVVARTLDDAAYVIASYGSWNMVPFSNSPPAGYEINYNYQNANQIALVAVPEPSTWLLAGLSALGLIGIKRRGTRSVV